MPVIMPTKHPRDGYPDLMGGNGNIDANLALAAAAPELLEALDSAIGFVGGWAGQYAVQHGLIDIHPTHQAIIDQCKAALAKARGEDT